MHGHPNPERYTLGQVRAYTRAIEAEQASQRLDAINDELALRGDAPAIRKHQNALLRATRRR
jgi:hypothetical protein